MKKLILFFLLGLFHLSIPAADESSAECDAGGKLVLPKVIYAVPGVEANLYFRNVFLCINPDNYVFDVDCARGRNDRKRWRFLPADGDAGSYPLTLSVYDEKGLVARGKTVVRVAPRNAGKGRKISLLLIGDSLTNAGIYPARLLERMRGENNPELTMIGSHAGMGTPPKPGGIAHEGYGGWTWHSFLTRWLDESRMTKPYDRFAAKSKFLIRRNGRTEFDFQQYLDRYADGKAPDFIIIQLGVNDVLLAEDRNIREVCDQIERNMKQMIGALRKNAPDSVIGVGMVTPGADQDAFGNNYRCGQTAWQYQKNVFSLNGKMLKLFQTVSDGKLFLIPTGTGLDMEGNAQKMYEPCNGCNNLKVLRGSNAVHPAASGYRQIGDVFYAWLKDQLNLQEINQKSNQ